MIILGLVGNPASGKSTVARQLETWGADWIDADTIAKQVLQSDGVREPLVAAFGSDILQDDQVDRGKLAERVFGDGTDQQVARGQLESIVHPPTRSRILQRLRTAASQSVALSVLDVPLLFESGWDLACDSIWCVDAAQDRLEQWAGERGWTAGQLRRRQASQLSIEEKKRLSNLCINNDGTLDDLRDEVRRQLIHWQQRIRPYTQESGQGQTKDEPDSSLWILSRVDRQNRTLDCGESEAQAG